MERIGKIGDYVVYWDKGSGDVQVGSETLYDRNGDPRKAHSAVGAMEIAKAYVEEFPNRS